MTRIRRPRGRNTLREGIGRSWGGLSTKLHIVADLRCPSMARVMTAGQRHDLLSLDAVMADLLVVRPDGPARRRPDRVLADKGVLLREDPGLPAPTRDQGHHSRALQPEGGPSPAR